MITYDEALFKIRLGEISLEQIDEEHKTHHLCLIAVSKKWNNYKFLPTEMQLDREFIELVITVTPQAFFIYSRAIQE